MKTQATPTAMPGSYVAFALVAKLVEGGPAGLIERLGLVACGSWIAVLAIRLMRQPRGDWF